jgi:hypothetical protein
VLTAALAYCNRQRPQLGRALRGEAAVDDQPGETRRQPANDRDTPPPALAGE